MALAQASDAVITGRLANGTADAPFDPTTVPVTLHVLEGVTTIDQRSVTPATTGAFEFTVSVQPGRTYFLAAEYKGAVYSVSRTAETLGEPVTLTVHEATTDTAVVSIASHTIIVTGAVRDERFVEILERAQVHNTSDRTLVPDFAAQGPAMLSFLRFALPPNATNLDVRSTLLGGDVLEVDRGFAVTTPVPPTSDEPHLFEFVYRLTYDGPSLDLSRTMRFGAQAIRVVVPEGVATLSAPQLTDLGATSLEGLRLFEGANVAPGERLTLMLEGLPQPTAWDRFTRGIERAYLTILAPVIVGAALAALLVWAFIRGRRLKAAGEAAMGPQERRAQLHRRLEDLEAGYRRGSLSRRRYLAEREQVREELVELALNERFAQTPNSQPSSLD